MGALIRRRTATTHQGDTGSGGGLYFSSPKTNLQFIHSGCTLLDCVLGGGWPLGRIVNVVGDKSTGKTLLAIEACANFLRQYPTGQILYVEAEAAFDREYAAALGLDTDKITLIDDVDTVEALFDMIGTFIGIELIKDKAVREREEVERKARGERRPKTDKPALRTTPALVVVDSLDALSDEAEAERSIRDGSMGAAKAKKMSELFRRLVRALGTTKTCVMIISQVRDAIGVTFGDKNSRSGGRALDFYTSVALWLAHIATITNTVEKVKRATAITVKAKCKKNKIALPYRECEFDLRFGYGIDDVAANLGFLESVGSLPKDIPALREFRRLRGRELVDGCQRLNAAVIQRWYEIERNFVPEHGKYAEDPT